MTEREPDTENVYYLDEYPELAKRVWLRRLARQRVAQLMVAETVILPFPDNDPDGAA